VQRDRSRRSPRRRRRGDPRGRGRRRTLAARSRAPCARDPRYAAALLAEVASRGFRTLDDAVESAAAAVAPGAGPTARLAAGARAYLDCAIARPAVFALTFRPELVDATHGTFLRDTRQLAGSLWASIHELASLWSHGAYAIAVRNSPFDAALESPVGARFQAELAIAPLLGPGIVGPKCKCPVSGTVSVLEVGMTCAGTVTMSTRELERLEILGRVTERQVGRLCRALRQHRAAGLVSRKLSQLSKEWEASGLREGRR
jgi:hypothetical protein